MQFTPSLSLLLTTFTSVLALGLWWGSGGRSSQPDPTASETLLQTLLEGSDESGASTVPAKGSMDEPPTPSAVTVPVIPEAGRSADPQLKVALLSQSPPRSISLQHGARCRRASGKVISKETLMDLLAVQRQGLISCGGERGRVLVNDRAYEGIIHLLNRGNGWTVINQINLERYVASVVGAEMPSDWNGEALKAQAVAARSYALVHVIRPASADWNLGDTTRWQAYAGLMSNTASTRKAASATNGIVLSFQGGLVESLYAATREISTEAHGHLGASMSQHGAQKLAEEGLRFNEILGRYYVGASLARIKTDRE